MSMTLNNATTLDIPTTIPVPVDFDNHALLDIFTTALEGGIGYWSACERYRWSNPDGSPDPIGFYADVVVLDADEAEVRPEHTIGRTTILKGLITLATEADPKYVPREYVALARGVLTGSDTWDDTLDADSADVVVQTGLFGRVVFG